MNFVLSQRRSRSAFTLVELLTVIAIMAILSSMLLPSLSRAREMARKTSCASNLRQLGMGIALYRDDNDSFYPLGYSLALDGTEPDGTHYRYTHWSWATFPYIKSDQVFVCPDDLSGGSSPSFCDCVAHPNCRVGQFYGMPPGPGVDYEHGGSAGFTDRQVLRLSYSANEEVMPRKPSSSTPTNVVLDSAIDTPAEVILLAEASGVYNDNGPIDGPSKPPTRSHRPLNVLSQGQIYEQYEAESGLNSPPIRALPIEVARKVLDGELPPPHSHILPSHIVHLAPDLHNNGANYLFCDGHVKWMHLEQTLDPTHFLWGTQMYSAHSAPILREDGVTPVR